MSSFSDPKAVACYTEGPSRLVPGFAGLQWMTAFLLPERLVKDARVRVLGGQRVGVEGLRRAPPPLDVR
jgi:tRNA (cmo5U34)-methyltransferase